MDWGQIGNLVNLSYFIINSELNSGSGEGSSAMVLALGVQNNQNHWTAEQIKE